PTPMADRIREMIDTTNGVFAVAFLNPENGEQILINAHEPFHAASTMKTPVMIEAFKNMKENNHRLLDSIEVYNTFYSIVDSSEFTLSADQDGDPDLYQLVGEKLTWQELIFRMI